VLTRLEQAPETGKSVQKRRLEPGFLAFLGRNRNDFRQRAGTKSFFSSLLVDEADPLRLRRLVDLARNLRPDVLTLKPTLLAALLEHQESPNLLAGLVGLVAVSGSDFGPEARALAEERLGVPVSEGYGLTEFGLVAAECGAKNGLHVDPEILPEIFDHETGHLFGESDAALAGELVLTSRRNAAYPLTRYRTGDFAKLIGGVCACGRRTPRLTQLSGRLVRNFRLPDGRLVSPSRFNGLFARHPMSEFQLVQQADGAFLLRAEPQRDARLDGPALVTNLREVIGPTAAVAVSIGPLPRLGKFQRYISEAL
jgi:phenylacetate-coenzyme A ligase PaaK-like adenylate-forming protein